MSLYLASVARPPPYTNWFAKFLLHSAVNTSFEIKLKAIGMFSSFRYLNELRVKCTMSALAISAAIASISLSKPVKLKGILKILKT